MSAVLHSTKFVNLVQAQPEGFSHPWVWAKRNQDTDGSQTKAGVQIAALVSRDNAEGLAQPSQSEGPIKVSGKDVFFLKTKRPSLIADHDYEYSLELAAGLNPAHETTAVAATREAESELGRKVQRIEVVAENNCSSSGITSELQHFTIAEVGAKEQLDIVDRHERAEVIQEIIRVPVEAINDFLHQQEASGVCVSALARAGLSFVLDRLSKEREQKLIEAGRIFRQIKPLAASVISSLATRPGFVVKPAESACMQQLTKIMQEAENILAI